jgi:hypothetical protein
VFLGVAEVLAAGGLTLPTILGIQPWLVPTAAAGLMIVMIGATIYHSARGETNSAITTAVLLLLVTFVAYMWWRVLPIRCPYQKLHRYAGTVLRQKWPGHSFRDARPRSRCVESIVNSSLGPGFGRESTVVVVRSEISAST